MTPAIERLADIPSIRIAARWLTVLSLVAIVLLAVGQQGGIGSSLDPVPDRPLPVDRHLIFGIDLMDRSSAGAVQWLDDSQGWTPAIVLASVDADITAAIADEEEAQRGLTALDTLISAAGSQTIALCLREPLAPQTTEELASAITETIVDSYSRQVAYVTTCDDADDDAEWRNAVAAALGEEGINSNLIPVASGPPIRYEGVNGFQDIAITDLRSFAGEHYVLVSVPTSGPPGPGEVEMSQDAIRNAAQIGAIVLRPGGEVLAGEFSAALGEPGLDDVNLVEGFNGVAGPRIQIGGDWSTTQIGAVEYIATEQPGSNLSVSFVGTSLYLHVIEGPDAGEIAIWIDDPPSSDISTADSIVDLGADQAQDTAIPIATDLPASTHEVTVVALDGEATVSGFFVSGEPEEQWAGGIATITLILIAVASLTVTSLARVRDIRRRTRAPAVEPHPRSFRSDS